MMTKKRLFSLLALLLLITLSFAACHGGGGGGAPAPAGPTTTSNSVSGRVSLSSTVASAAKASVAGESPSVPNAGVTITSFDTAGNKTDSQTVTSGTAGFFTASLKMNNSGGYVVIDVTKDGFTGYSKRIDFTSPSEVNLNAELRTINTVVASLGTVFKSNGQTIQAFKFGVVKYTNGVKKALSGSKLTAAKSASGATTELEIEIPATSVPTGVTTLVGKLQTFDSSNPDDAKSFPGDYVDANGNKLVSLAFDYINITDGDGNNLGQLVSSAKASGKMSKAATDPTYITRRIPSGSCNNLLSDFCTGGTGDDALCANLGTAEKNAVNVPIYTYNSRKGNWVLLGLGTIDGNNDGVIDSMDVLTVTGEEFCSTNYGAYLRILVTNTDFLASWWNLDYPLLTAEPKQVCVEKTFNDSEGNPLQGVYAYINDDDSTQSFNYVGGSTNDAGTVKLNAVLITNSDTDRTATLSFYNPFAYTYETANVTLGDSPTCISSTTVIVKPKRCTVEGRVVDEAGTGKANQNLSINGSYPSSFYAWAYTNSTGNFTVEVSCEQNLVVYLAGWMPMATFNVNGNSSDFTAELTDANDKVVLNNIILGNMAPFAYGYLNSSSIKVNGSTSAWIYGYDSDGNYPLTYKITNAGTSADLFTGTISSTEWWKEVTISGLAAGDYQLTLTVTDSLGKPNTPASPLGTLTVTDGNRPPVISYAYPSTNTVTGDGQVVNLYSWAYDLDNGPSTPLTYSWSGAAGIASPGSAATTFTVPANSMGTVFTLGLTVSDGADSDSRTIMIDYPCAYLLSETNYAFPAAGGGPRNITVTTGANCSWSVYASDSWITISPTSGQGNGTVSYTVAANTGTNSRMGSITIAGRQYSITQDAAACSYSLSATAASADAGGGSGSVNISSSTAACSWRAFSNAPWITVVSGASGSGNGIVQYFVAPNTAITERIGTLSIGGQTFTITQAGAVCKYSVSPLSANFGPDAGTGTFTVTTQAGCTWTAATADIWISITSGSSGTGSGNVRYSVTANSATSASRLGTLTIAGNSYTVAQSGAACNYAISPTSNSVTSAASAGSVSVLSPTGCSWTATSNDAWITITAGTTGSGNGAVAYSVAANPSSSQRIGTVTIAGQTFTVTQQGALCSYTITPTSNSVTSAATTGSVNVSSPTGCSWTATSNDSWITITAGTSGSGNGAVTYSVAANAAGASRTGTMTIAGQTFTLTQGGAGCSYTISQTSNNFVAAGGSGSVNVTSATGCAWTAASNNTWITITAGSSGSGNGAVSYSVAANTAGVSRTGTMTIAGNTFTVTQDAASCSFSISPTSNPFGYTGGLGSVSVTTATGCAWTAASNDSWITVTAGSSGSGNGPVDYTVAANASSLTRIGTLTIGGQTFTVTQTGVTCTYSISPSSATLGATAGSGTVAVTSPAGCGWSATSNDGWITITAGASGTGNGTVSYSVSENTGGANRTGTLSIQGNTFTVTQDWRTDVTIIIQ